VAFGVAGFAGFAGFAGHNSFQNTWNLIQNLHFLGLSSDMSEGGALLLSKLLLDLPFL